MNKIYFSQYDSRWATQPYTSTNNNSQTIKSSGCGPTSAAMVVSSLRNNIVLPSTMAKDFVASGFRTAGSGTSWSAFDWIASKYLLKCKSTTDINEVINCLNSGGMCIASSRGSNTALFSTAGHILVLSGVRDGKIEIMDSALYNGKYDLPHRKGKVTVEGNYIYVAPANIIPEIRRYYCYTPIDTGKVITSNKTMRVINVDTRLRIRKSPNINSEIVGYLNKDDVVTIYSKNDNWYNIGNGWVSGTYLADMNEAQQYSHTTGKYRITVNSVLNVRVEPSVNARAKTFEELTANAQSQIKKLKGTGVNGYVNNMVCTVSEIKDNWGKTPSGWICLDYCVKI